MTAQNPTDQEQIIQLIIDYPELQQYYHEGLAGRKPLYILKTAALDGEPRLTKFGAPVGFKERQDLSGSDYEAYIEFLELKIGEGASSATFTYAVEGVFAKVRLSKTDGQWRIDTYSIAER